MNTITVKDYIEGKAEGKKVYTETAWGRKEVTSFRRFSDGPWIVCGKDNGGFGMSYAVCLDEKLYVEE